MTAFSPALPAVPALSAAPAQTGSDGGPDLPGVLDLPGVPDRSGVRGSAVRALWRFWAEPAFLALSVSCAGCGRPDRPVCRSCLRELSVRPRRVPVPSDPLGLPAWSGPAYDGTVARAVVAWKERGRTDLTRVLAEELAGVLDLAVRTTGAGVLVPVPSSRRARRRRGQDLVAGLARRSVHRRRAAGGEPRVRLARALRVVRPVADQTGLGPQGRRRNLQGALGPAPGGRGLVGGRSCLVLDDVLTTGATALEAARALHQMGAEMAGIVTFCATPPRRGLSQSGPLV
ncbi:MAG: hypothetical protein QG608_3274 [Actinomycetota bacterium]|nr:hypothetical protein [Actinomycetota bacterium]